MQAEIPTVENSEIYHFSIIIFIGVCSRCRKRLSKIRQEVPAEEVKEVSVKMSTMNLVRYSMYKNHMMLNAGLNFSIMDLFTGDCKGTRLEMSHDRADTVFFSVDWLVHPVQSRVAVT